MASIASSIVNDCGRVAGLKGVHLKSRQKWKRIALVLHCWRIWLEVKSLARFERVEPLLLSLSVIFVDLKSFEKEDLKRF